MDVANSDLWLGVAAACVLVFAIKFSGYALPERWVSGPAITYVSALVTVALLAALVGQQALVSSEPGHTWLQVDARVPAVIVAIVALLARAPFIVVIVLAALTAAALRALQVMA